MYTIFSASNREDNKTQVFAELSSKLLSEIGIENQVFNLQQLPMGLSGAEMYNYGNSPVADIVEKYLKPVDKVIFVIPEYNGSFPGILKLFIDAIHPSNFKGKKTALIGVSSGRSGNVRGMDHLTGILHYLKADVYHYKLAISAIDKLISEDEVRDEGTLTRMREQLLGFMEF